MQTPIQKSNDAHKSSVILSNISNAMPNVTQYPVMMTGFVIIILTETWLSKRVVSYKLYSTCLGFRFMAGTQPSGIGKEGFELPNPSTPYRRNNVYKPSFSPPTRVARCRLARSVKRLLILPKPLADPS